MHCIRSIIYTAIEKAETAYKNATTEGDDHMPSTHPIRLGLALNHSVFHFEIKNQRDKACELAKKVGIFCVMMYIIRSCCFYRHLMMLLLSWTI